MRRLVKWFKNLFRQRGYVFSIPDAIVVGLPMSDKNQYELHVRHGSKGPIGKWPVKAYNVAEYYPERQSVRGFSFEQREGNTCFVEFDVDYFHLWYADKPDYQHYFSVLDVTNDFYVIRDTKLIMRRGM